MSLKQPDILDAVRFSFTTAKEAMKRDDRNDPTKLRKQFIKCYQEICYPLLYNANMPEFDLRNHNDMEIRGTIVINTTKLIKKNKLLEYLLDGREEFVPFNLDELRYEILA